MPPSPPPSLQDISKYNEIQTIEDPNEETGWKLVHGDVFRAPTFSPMMMSVFVGTGVQVSVAVQIYFFTKRLSWAIDYDDDRSNNDIRFVGVPFTRKSVRVFFF